MEVVGTYNPRTNPASVELKRDRIDYWRSKGAQFSDRVKETGGQAAAAASPSEPGPRQLTRLPTESRTMSTVNMVALVEHLAKVLVNAPDEVEVEAFEEGDRNIIELFVAEDDLGRLSGARAAWRGACAR